MQTGVLRFLSVANAAVLLLCTACARAQTPPPPPPAAVPAPAGLTWDSEQKEFNPTDTTTNYLFSFAFTNNSPAPITITGIKPSCGCTTVQTPALPWVIPPGSNGTLAAAIDLRNKWGTLMKAITVDSSAGTKHLIARLNLPQPPTPAQAPIQISERVRNQMLAQTDRQIVFRGECAKCHAEPAKDKLGGELYAAACAICHDTPNRATMVPDLANLNKPTNEAYWQLWIRFGKVGSLMPAFGRQNNGPLTDEQIDSLAKWLAGGGIQATKAAAVAAPGK
jgi:cytochrome c553